MDDDDSDFEGEDEEASASASASASSSSSTTTTTTPAPSAKQRKARTAKPVAKAAPVTSTELVSETRLGIYNMLVLAFYWFGLPVEADSVRHSKGRDVVWLRHVVFVILELEVSSRAKAAAIGPEEIKANEFLDYKNQHNRVTSPWNGFRRFLAELDSPEHAHHEREALERGDLSCGKLTMKNMKRRPPCPRGPKSTSSSAPKAEAEAKASTKRKAPDSNSKSKSNLAPRKKLKSAKQLRAEAKAKALSEAEAPRLKRPREVKREAGLDDEEDYLRSRHFKKLSTENQAVVKEMQEAIRDSERLDQEIQKSMRKFASAIATATCSNSNEVIDLTL